MELILKPYHQNTYPLNAFLIKGTKVKDWILALQGLNIDLEAVEVYPLPNTSVKSVWGCLVVMRKPLNGRALGKYELCQSVLSNFFIPEKTTLFPRVRLEELKHLFPKQTYLYHPIIGLVELEEPLDFSTLLVLPDLKSRTITIPADSVFIPKEVKVLRVQPLSEETVMQNMKDEFFPKPEKMKDEPLSLAEKGKLAFYKLLFSGDKGKLSGKGSEQGFSGSSSFLQQLAKLMESKGGGGNSWMRRLQKDFEELERRNKEQVDRLMDLFRKNPEEALKYAVPLDGEGVSRGNDQGELGWGMRWGNFSLFGNTVSSGRGGGAFNIGDRYLDLQRQYNKTAEDLIKQKQYKKAAFVYLKLLRNYYQAAHALELGKYYEEAALIHIKYNKNKFKAAECYEKGNMLNKAIELFIECGQNERAGDLFLKLKQKDAAMEQYQMVVDAYLGKNMYVKGALLSRRKMCDLEKAQGILLEGWDRGKDAFNCLNNYFNNIKDSKLLSETLERIYQNKVDDANRLVFLEVLQYEYKKKTKVKEQVRNIAYEIIAKEAVNKPNLVDKLIRFNEENKELFKDTMRFKMKKR